MDIRAEMRQVVAEEVPEDVKITMCMIAAEAMTRLPDELADIIGRLPYFAPTDIEDIYSVEKPVNDRIAEVFQRYDERN